MRRSVQLWEQHWSTQYCALTIYGTWRIPAVVTLSVLILLWGTLYSVDPGTGDLRTRGPGTQGPKLACTVHVCTVASSLGEYPGPRAFRVWVCVSNRMEWAIEFISKDV